VSVSQNKKTAVCRPANRRREKLEPLTTFPWQHQELFHRGDSTLFFCKARQSAVKITILNLDGPSVCLATSCRTGVRLDGNARFNFPAVSTFRCVEFHGEFRVHAVFLQNLVQRLRVGSPARNRIEFLPATAFFEA